jgi:hypothetical protein
MPGDMSVIIAPKGGDVKLFNAARRRRGGTSRMARECQVRFCEGLGAEFPGLLGNRAILAMRHPLPVYPISRRFQSRSALRIYVSRRHSILDTSPHGAAGLIFCYLSLAASRRNISLRFLALAVAAPAHHHWCQYFIAARW